MAEKDFWKSALRKKSTLSYIVTPKDLTLDLYGDDGNFWCWCEMRELGMNGMEALEGVTKRRW